MEGRLEELHSRVERDFADPKLTFPGLRFAPAAEWPRLVPEINPPQAQEEQYRSTDLVCMSGSHSFLVDGTLDDQELLVQVSSVLQGDAIDALSEPWPSINVGGEFMGVLEPVINATGVAVWAARSGFSCPIGYLQEAFGSGGLIA